MDGSLDNCVIDVHAAHDYASEVGNVDEKYFLAFGDTIKVWSGSFG